MIILGTAVKQAIREFVPSREAKSGYKSGSTSMLPLEIKGTTSGVPSERRHFWCLSWHLPRESDLVQHANGRSSHDRVYAHDITHFGVRP